MVIVSRSLSKTDSLLTNNIKNSMSIEEKRNTRTVMDMTEILNCLFKYNLLWEHLLNVSKSYLVESLCCDTRMKFKDYFLGIFGIWILEYIYLGFVRMLETNLSSSSIAPLNRLHLSQSICHFKLLSCLKVVLPTLFATATNMIGLEFVLNRSLIKSVFTIRQSLRTMNFLTRLHYI